jgi:hypothetical protein
MSDRIYHKMPGTISGEDLTYLIYYDDRDRPLEIIVGEKAARKRYEDISVSWNAHLFVLIDNNAKDDKAPVALLAAEGKRVEELVQASILERSKSEGLETEITAIRTHLLARAEAAEAERDKAQAEVNLLIDKGREHATKVDNAEDEVRALRKQIEVDAQEIRDEEYAVKIAKQSDIIFDALVEVETLKEALDKALSAISDILRG